jgi:S1-C subfamily serine protease
VPAKVVAMFHDTDLALIEIPREEMAGMEGICESHTMKIASAKNSIPPVRSKVNVVGYPVGGDRVSVTEGVVSRVDMVRYSHSGRYAASITVDSPINAGNSGGPIVDPLTGEIVGVAFQKMVGNGIENQGHGVPPYLIWRFLNGLDRPRGTRLAGDQLASLGIAIQSLESRALREYLGATRGVLVNWSTNPLIHSNDVIVGVAGNPVDNNGLINFLDRRIHFSALIHGLFCDETVEINILRNGQLMQIHTPLVPSHANELVPMLQYGVKPQYIVTGGLVFQPLSMDYLQGWPERERPSHLQELVNTGKVSDELKQVIVLTNVLASQCNAGYGSGWVGAPILKTFNDVAVRDIVHLSKLIDEALLGGKEFMKFTFRGFLDDQVIVLKCSQVLAENLAIQAMYDIPKLVSV